MIDEKSVNKEPGPLSEYRQDAFDDSSNYLVLEVPRYCCLMCFTRDTVKHGANEWVFLPAYVPITNRSSVPGRTVVLLAFSYPFMKRTQNRTSDAFHTVVSPP